MRAPRGRQLGKALGVIARAEAAEIIMHQDVSAFGAPSECHEAVAKGEARRMRQARRLAKSICGLSYNAMRFEAERRTSGRVLHFAIDEGLVGRILYRDSPYI